MAQRRMFSPEIVCSEEFLSMPVSSRDLYIQLSMRADDDGFIQPRLVMKTIGSDEDDLKVLLAKRFLLSFEDGVVVIKHWLIHNIIRADRYKPTRFQEQKQKITIKENKAYTERFNPGLHSGNQMATQVRLGEVRIGKNSDFAKAQSLPLEVSQEQPVITFEEWLEANKYTPTTYYAGEEEGEVEGWRHPTRKSPFNESELRKRYLGTLRPQTSRYGAPGALQGMLEVWSKFENLCEKEIGKKPIIDAKSRNIIKLAIEKVGKTEVLDIIEEWFSLGKPDEETIQITRALSGNQLNAHRART